MSSTTAGLLQVGLLLLALAVAHRPFGDHLARVYTGERHLGVERAVYRIARVDPDSEQRWSTYALGVLGFSFVGAALLYVLQRAQSVLPWDFGRGARAPRPARPAAVAGPVVGVWDAPRGYVGAPMAAPDGATGAVALAVLPDLRVVVAASGREETLLWDAESGHVLTRLSTPGRGGAVALAPQPDGHLLVAVSGRDGDPPRVVRVDVRW
ncbi:potassium-transporting ATPase subunit KdpA [Saccharothrix sp. MB29]|nr:potassium-transporting ATPase subunit KdpA [Saccharothrix sp. MB29]